MKRCFAVIVLLTSLASQAEIIKLHDGTVARCETKADVARHSISGVYRPVSVESNRIVIEILTCKESKNGYVFKRDSNFEDKTIRPIVSPERKLHIEHSALTVLIVNGDSKLVDKKELIKGRDNLYSANFNPGNDDFIEFHIQTQIKLTDVDSGEIIDQGVDTYGAYRIR